jgi:hypothetical protein
MRFEPVIPSHPEQGRGIPRQTTGLRDGIESLASPRDGGAALQLRIRFAPLKMTTHL